MNWLICTAVLPWIAAGRIVDEHPVSTSVPVS